MTKMSPFQKVVAKKRGVTIAKIESRRHDVRDMSKRVVGGRKSIRPWQANYPRLCWIRQQSHDHEEAIVDPINQQSQDHEVPMIDPINHQSQDYEEATVDLIQ
ncbi:hypothetical protein ACH5RR_012455 [Cinchona calisaya]|uniref:Uncharacterized protein n=1 Tax=Cinchona calisaya TaxID=153742 RepID=A0ABD3A7V6_9GENT